MKSSLLNSLLRNCLPLLLFVLFAFLPPRLAEAQTLTYNATGGDQTYNVSRDGDYTITVRGADGGNLEVVDGNDESTLKGGSGATVTATFPLLAGDILTIVAGVKGESAPNVLDDIVYNGTGGGGGSAVTIERGNDKKVLIAAGAGGGGGGNDATGMGGEARDAENRGGDSFVGAGGGGGFNANGDGSIGGGGRKGTVDGGGNGAGTTGEAGARGGYGFGGGGGGFSAAGGGGGYRGGDAGGSSPPGPEGRQAEGGASFVRTSDIVGTNIQRTDGTAGGSTSSDGLVTIQGPCPDITAQFNGPTAVCAGGSANLSVIIVGGTSPYSITYQPSSGSNIDVSGYSSGGALMATPSSTTTYTLISVADANGCAATIQEEATKTVTVNPLPTATVGGGGTVCPGEDLPDVEIALTGAAPFTLTYSDGENSTEVTTSNSTYVIANAPAGTYTVTSLTDANGCAGTSLSGSATAASVPTPRSFAVTGGGAYCADGAGVAVGLADSEVGVRYQLQFVPENGSPNNSAGSVQGTGGPLSFGNQTSAGTFYVVGIRNTANCRVTKSMRGNAKVTVDPLPTVTVSVLGDDTVCEGEDLPDLLLTFTGTAPFDFTLTDGTDPQDLTTPPFNAPIPLEIIEGGTYSVTALSDANGCTASSLPSSATVTVNPLPTATISGGGTVCAGENLPNVSIDLTGAAPFNLTYSDGSNPTNVTTSDNPYVIANAPAGTYTVTSLSDANGCSASSLTDEATVTVNPLPMAFAVTGGGAYCADGAGLTVGLSSSQSGVNYQLRLDGSDLGSPVAGTGSPLDFGSQTAAGTYTVQGTNETTNCTETMSGSVSVSINPRPGIVASPDQLVIFGYGSNCVEISAKNEKTTPPYTFSWSGSRETGNTITVCPDTTTTYTVTATDASGCTSDPAEVTVSVQDVRCGPKQNKVSICYYGVTQCVSQKIAKRYLRLGATLGSCGSSAARIGAPEADELPFTLSLRAYPNPVLDALTVEVLSPSAGAGTFEVLDMQGRARQTQQQVLSEGRNEVLFRLGSLPTGIYLIKAVDALKRQAVVRVSRQ